MEQLEKITKSVYPEDVFTIGHVEYSKRKQKALFRKEAESIVRQVRAYVKANKTINGFDWNQCRLQYHHALLSKGVYVKHPFFFEEKEWRICLWGSKLAQLNEIILAEPNTILTNKEFVQKFNEIQKAFERDFDDQSDNINDYPNYPKQYSINNTANA